ncbi:nitroreductase family protein [Candidatus Woesearchaeota archaeon]|nr:nitroreductase family protein [Candidatus Woesearchaeota archaeon]
MDLTKAIIERSSVRSYKNKQVKIEEVLEVLNIAKEAPSSGNIQNWRFIIVIDESKIKEISTACLSQSWMSQAPVHIVICNDYQEVIDNYNEYGKKYSVQNCAIVAQNIMLTATDFGLGTCFVAAFDDFALHRILKIPESINIEAVITLGYPSEIEKEKKYGLEITTSINEYGSKKMPSGSLIKDFLKRIRK